MSTWIIEIDSGNNQWDSAHRYGDYYIQFSQWTTETHVYVTSSRWLKASESPPYRCQPSAGYYHKQMYRRYKLKINLQVANYFKAFMLDKWEVSLSLSLRGVLSSLGQH